MIHVKKTSMKKEVEKLVEKKANEKVVESVSETTDVKAEETEKRVKEKKEPIIEERYNGLHAYTLTYMQKNVAKKAFVIARTEETAKNRVKNELSDITQVILKRIPDEEGHKIIKKARKAGIFPVTT